MKNKYVLIVSYAAFLLSVFLPWFTYNPEVMGYRYGIVFLPWMIVPIIIIGIAVFSKKKTILLVLGELGIVSLAGMYIEALGHWQEYCNIKTGYHWTEGINTATACYWLSLGLFFVLAVIYQFLQFRRRIDAI